MLNFNIANNYFYLDCIETWTNQIGVEFTDNTVYRAKKELRGITQNVTAVYPATAVNTTLTTAFSGKIKVFCNRQKVIGVSINLGISGQLGDWSKKNDINIDASFLQQFPNLKKFRFFHRIETPGPSSGAITGDWAAVPLSLEFLEFSASDYPNKTAIFDIDNIPLGSQLKTIVLGNATPPFKVKGSLQNIPSSCTHVDLGNGIFANYSVTGTLPSQLKHFYFSGNNTISGSIPTGMLYLVIAGNNTLSGSIPSGLLTLSVTGNNTLSGTIPASLTTLTVTGNNTLSGTIPASLTTLTVTGNNTLSGTIPASVTSATILGNNTISGTLPVNMTNCDIAGNNTITGNIPVNMTNCGVAGNNTITGNIPNKISYLSIAGNNTITYSSIVWPATMARIHIRASALTSAMVDQMLIDLANVTTWVGQKSIDIQGNSGPRTAASNAAVATLLSKGVSVLTN